MKRHDMKTDRCVNQRRDNQNSNNENVLNRKSGNTSQQINRNQLNNRNRDGINRGNDSEFRNKQFYGCNDDNKSVKSNRSQRNNMFRDMSYKRLEELITKYSSNATDLLLNLKCDNSFLNLISNEDKLKGKFGDYLFLCNVIQALSLISECDNDLLLPYFEEINAKHFELSIVQYLNRFHNLVNTRNSQIHRNTFENLVNFLSSFQKLLLKSSTQKISLIIQHLTKIGIKSYNRERIISQESVHLIEVIVSENDKMKASNDFELDSSRFENILEDKFRNDFRNTSIFPTNQDLRERPIIQTNIVIGKYDNEYHYLEIQFKLLREDFIRPLREGISEYLQKFRENKSLKKLNNIRIYNNVKITGSEFKNGLIYSATFNIKDYKHVRWQNSKQLIYGSMLCLTSNNFKSFCIATVAGNRDPKLLTKGIFQFKLETQAMEEEMIEFSSNSLIMAETQAYFEAYRHNLLALQQFMFNEFPLKEYLINVSNDIKYLSHLDRNTTYDLSDLALSLEKLDSEKITSIIKSLNQRDYYNKNLTFLDQIEPHLTSIRKTQLKNICVLNDINWPTASLLGVDESQYEAIKASLTKQLVVIQGPPGTGKTFVGLRIVQILLRNKLIWNTRKTRSPILIVCYTNHALDQFLEGMIPFCKIMNGIVRIGGRCKSQILDRYTLTNLKREMQTKRVIPQHIFIPLKDTKNELMIIQNNLSSVQNQIQKSRTRLLGNKLKKTIEKMIPINKMNYIINQLMSLYDQNFKSALIKWLTIKLNLKKVWIDLEEQNKTKHSILTRIQIKEMQGFCFSQLSSNDMMSEEEVIIIEDIIQISHNDRWRLYRLWHKLYRHSKLEELNELNQAFDEKRKHFIKLKINENTYSSAIFRTRVWILEENLKEIKEKITSVETQIKELRTKFLGSELRFIIDYPNSDKSAQIVENYGQDFDLAIMQWLTIEVVLREVWEEVETQYYINMSDVIDDQIDETESYISHDSEPEIHFEVDEEEVQNILDSRIIEDDQSYHENNAFVFNSPKKYRNRLEKEMRPELSSCDTMSFEEVMRIIDISKLSNKDRWRLYRYWRKEYCQEREIIIKELTKKYAQKLKQFERIKLEEDLFVIKECDIIGLTTTGAAKFRTIIQQIDPLIVVVEEAAEVLESHVVTSLTKSTKHLILIGDHQQLKPNPAVYDLAVNYNLDVSLFERMIKNKVPFYQLKIQHRMRPSISSLLVPHIYKELRDHESVFRYEDIKGVSKSMFFINHNHRESVATNDNLSKKNEFEAEFILRLCKYLILQEYKPSQITILTMYSAQLFLIKQLMKKHGVLNGVHATVLDNYQGEESDIILLSFVRSNSSGEIGFLKVPNRVNVSLSRARFGMYCIGNFDCLSKKSELWNNIKKSLIRTKEIDSTLELYCVNHPKNKTFVSKASDFDKVPEGGCLEQCMQTLKCSHKCPLICHVYDKEHNSVVCDKKCLQIVCQSKHICKDKCHHPNKCKPCSVMVNQIIPLCGHQIKIQCSSDPSKSLCYKPCDKTLICGHRCTQICSNDCNKKLCTSIVIVESKCGHRVEIECGKQSDVETQLNNCSEKCETELKCSHECKGSCGQCNQKRLHVFCGEKCERLLSCGHVCKALCGQSCRCNKKCHFNKCENCGQVLNQIRELFKKIDESINRNSKFDFNISSNAMRKLNKLKMETKKRDITKLELSVIMNKLEMIEQIVLFNQNLINWKNIHDIRQDFIKINGFIDCLNIRLNKFLNFIDGHYCNQDNCQQIFDAENERNRFFVMSETLKVITENQFNEEGTKLLIEVFERLSNYKPFNDYREQKIKLLISYAEEYTRRLIIISDLSPYSTIIKEYFDNSRVHAHINITLKSIQKYNNNELKDRFRRSFAKEHRMLLWHGTKIKFLKSIYEEGLKLPLHGGMFGKGIYFADRVTKSVQYTDCGISHINRVGTLLLCEVAVGNMLETGTANHHLKLPIGYESVKGVGTQTVDMKDSKIIDDGLLVPSGRTIVNTNGPKTSLIHNEYVIYDIKRVLIRFVVEIDRH